MAAKALRQSGFTLIEGIASGTIIAVAVTGMFTAWISVDNRFSNSRIVSVAGQVGRAEMERAKVFGIANLPLGVYAACSNTASWQGTFDPTAAAGAGAWTSGEASYFDQYGSRLPNSTGAVVQVEDSLTDSNILTTGSSYGFQLTSYKSVVITATATSDGSTLFSEGTNIVMGGT
jgi:type II secretory pathway pseudopilin PulG